MAPYPKILSIGTGGGGLDLGIRIACPQARAVCYVEREAWCIVHLVDAIEKGLLDDAPVWDDARTFDGHPWRGAVDLILAGYPCQPFSVAGRRRGETDPRHLWPTIARIIREVHPPFVFLENVANHLRLGFRSVRDDLRAMGYGIEAGLFTAAEVGAPHERKRLFVLAYHEGDGQSGGRLHTRSRREGAGTAESDRAGSAVANGEGNGRGQGTEPLQSGTGEPEPTDSGEAVGYPEKQSRRESHHEKCPVSRKNARDASCGAGSRMVDSRRSRWRARDEGRRCSSQRDDGGGQAAGGAGESGEAVGHADAAGRNEAVERSPQIRRPFPPGPADYEAWREIIREDLGLSPATLSARNLAATIEPAFRGMVDGLASRVHALRALGNGVVPLVAAVAFLALLARVGKWCLWRLADER